MFHNMEYFLIDDRYTLLENELQNFEQNFKMHFL